MNRITSYNVCYTKLLRADLGVRKMRLMTNNPKKIVGLKSYGLEIVERVPIESMPNEINENYLTTKRDKMGHLIMHQQ